jgi:hypothetical protein
MVTFAVKEARIASRVAGVRERPSVEVVLEVQGTDEQHGNGLVLIQPISEPGQIDAAIDRRIRELNDLRQPAKEMLRRLATP